ncbi:MAG: hypothetical protein LBQ36_03220 [Synergistaceae bacterium]|nr:hypothetical protein [Synergistaceae bacterium]
MSAYASFVVTYFTLYFFGYSLKVLLLNGDLKKYDLYITPWLGMGLIIMVLFPLSWLGHSVESAINYFAGSVFLLNLAIWLKFKEVPCFEKREVIFMAVIGFFVCTVYASPLAAADYDLYAVTLSGDFASYLNAAKAALISSARVMHLMPVGIPHISIIDFSFSPDLRGCVFVQAAFSALYRINLIYVSYMLSAFVMFLNISAFRLFLKGAHNLAVTIPVVGILAFNVFYQEIVFSAFTGQLFSIGFVSLAFFIEFYLVERGKFDPRSCLLLVFLLTSNSLNYIEAMAYPLIPAVSLLIVLVINKGYRRKHCLQNMALAGGLFAVLNIIMIADFIKVFFLLEGQYPGFAIHMPTFMDVAGLHGATDSPDVFFSLLIASNVIFALVILRQLRREGLRSFLSVSFAIYFLLLLCFCLRYFDLGEKSSYNAYKSALSLSFIAVILMLRFLEDHLGRFISNLKELRANWASPRRLGDFLPMGKGLIVAALFAAFFCLNVSSTWRDLNLFLGSKDNAITKDLDILTFYANSPHYSGSDFIINFDLPLPQLSATYGAPFGRAYTSDYGGILGDSRRQMKGSFASGDIYIASTALERSLATTDAAPIFQNDVYSIHRLAPESLILFDYKGLSHQPKKFLWSGGDGFLRVVEENSVILEYMTMKERSADLSVTFYDFGESGAQNASLYVMGQRVRDFSSNDSFIKVLLEGIELKPGINDITIEFGGDVSGLALIDLKYEIPGDK